MKTPAVVLYLEDVLAVLERYCDNLDLNDTGQVVAPKGCKCTACRFAVELDKALTAEWRERCGTANGTLPPSAVDAGAGEPKDSPEP